MEQLPGLDPVARAVRDQHVYWNELFAWSYTAYFVVFALGTLLLLLYALSPRESVELALTPGAWDRLRSRLAHHRRSLGAAGGFLLCLLCALAHQTRIDETRGFIADQEKKYEKHIRELSRNRKKDDVLKTEYLYIPEGDSLAYMSLGNVSLAADYLWLTSLQYVSSAFRRGHKYDLLVRFYNAMTELDPHWIEAEVNAGKILSALEDDRDRVEAFYRRAILLNPGDHRLYYEAGRLFVVPPQNHALLADYASRAVTYFKHALAQLRRRPSTPAVTALIRDIEGMIPMMGKEAGYFEVADEMLWKRMHDKANPHALRTLAAREWLGVRSTVIVKRLEKLVGKFKERHGTWPPSLEPIFDALPERGADCWKDKFGFPIDYDLKTGKVSSRGVNAVRAIQVAAVIRDLINVYRMNEERFPPSLGELQRWTRDCYSDPMNPPSQIVIDALGTEFDCVNGPLGPWNYDPDTGTLKLPDECNLETLYRPVQDMVKDEQ